MKSPFRPPRASVDKSHPVRGAWIEMPAELTGDEVKRSHPVRGAWIEIKALFSDLKHGKSVAPRQGCVD